MTTRPSFIVSARDLPESTHRYPHSEEPMGPTRRVGKVAGLIRIGVNLQRLPPGTRSSWPHAEENEEEFAYVIEGEVDAWINGNLHRMSAGDFAAFPAGTGICHCFINNTERDAILLVGGEASKAVNRIFYPLNPSRRADMKAADWWEDVPQQTLGPHDGKPDALRGYALPSGASR
ncbi:MAG: cupin domain-containing protein [Rudaea sp.]